MKLLKIIKKTIIITSISLILLLSKEALAGMDSGGFKIWLDNISSGGGRQDSTNYQIDGNLTTQTGSVSQSDSFKESVVFSGIEDEPTVGFNVQEVSIDFGELSPNSTAYSSHTFAAFTNAMEGYTIRVYGEPLNSDQYTLTEIGATADTSQTGTEQFGLNLVANSGPVGGADPSGGIGQAAANYNTADNYAFTDGAVIAQAVSFSYQTDFTVSVIVNIAEDTPSGIYGTTLTYEFIPVF